MVHVLHGIVELQRAVLPAHDEDRNFAPKCDEDLEQRGLLDERRLNEILSVESMTRGGIVGEQGAGGAGKAGRAGAAGKAGGDGEAGGGKK